MINILLSTQLANCTNREAFLVTLELSGTNVVKDWKNPRRMNKTHSNVIFEHCNDEDKTFKVLIDNRCL